MKSLLAFGILFFALSFCGITDKIKERMEQVNTPDSTTKTGDNDSPDTSKDSGGDVEKAELSAKQKEILDGGSEAKWDDQGITFTVPDGWKKMDVKKESFNYGSPKTGFLIGTISVMPANFPADTSLNATHTSALEQLKNGKYENVRWLEIDGVKGVEWVEAAKEDAGDPRRHQWIGFRNYQGQNQQLNIMVSTKSSEFNDKKDDFAAILYSMKIDK
ncbi:MAG: hypothetical protein KDB79_05500 [Acidobacteria bacterium]|nr:hypothetical protein [Acidobacteriota bacterium]